MEIVKLHPPYLYAVRYVKGHVDAYMEAVRTLTNLSYLQEYFRLFNDRIDAAGEEIYGFPREKVLLYANKAHADMQDLYGSIERCCRELTDGKIPHFGDCFKPHSNYDVRSSRDGGGKSISYKVGYLPVKSKGGNKNSLVRIYAIELSLECYIIIYGGIKITKKTQDTPALDDKGNLSTLEEEICKKVTDVCGLLASQRIIDAQGVEELIDAGV